jgi:hypothetical protein
MAGVSVAFTCIKSGGAVITGTATTGTNGQAVYKFRLKRNDRLGTYQVKASASQSGISTTASTSFTVQ